MTFTDKKVTVRIPEPQWTIVSNFTPNFTRDGVLNSSKSCTKTLMEILGQGGFQSLWNKILVLACVIAVSLDPLFFYIPTINQQFKCFDLDNKLKVSAVIWRSIFDLFYVADIVYNLTKAYKVVKRKEANREIIRKSGLIHLVKHGRIPWCLIIFDFLALLPIPQVIILVQWSKLKGIGSMERRKYLNFLLLSHYIPRIVRIYLSCKELTKSLDKLTGIVWVKGLFNLFLYMLASHVFGALWYFFSFQREMSCWHQACKKAGHRCVSRAHYCGDRELENSAYIKLLSVSCPIKPENPDIFDFGIYHEVLMSGVLDPNTDFLQKLAHCFWWGLRNMSSMGQNLNASTNIWENIFSVSISLSGLLLFLYLIGNLQTYMQLATARSEEISEKMKLKELDIDLWINKNGLPKHIKTSIMKSVKITLEAENKDIDVENLYSILPREEKKFVKRYLCLPAIRKVPIFKDMDYQIWELICDRLKPVIYTENCYIVREGDPLDRMLFITQGTAWEYYKFKSTSTGFTATATSTSSSSKSTYIRRLKKRDYFGEELVKWSLTHTTISDFPFSATNLKSHTKVEAFALMANDLMNALRTHWWLFRRNLPADSEGSHAGNWETLALKAIQAFRRNKQLTKIKSTPSHECHDNIGASTE